MRTIQIRLYPSPAQKREINTQLDAHRLLYNKVLTFSNNEYETFQHTISTFDLIKTFVNEARKEPLYKRCNYSSLQQTVRRYGKAREAMIQMRMKGLKCSLRLKEYHRFNSIEFTYSDGCRIKNDKVFFQNVGFIKAGWYTEVVDPTRVILTRRGDKYYASFPLKSFDGTAPQTGKAIGLDFGENHFLTSSDGEIIDSPLFEKQARKRLAKAHRAIHRQPKKTPQRRKRVYILNKISGKVANQRKNFAHQLSRKLVNQYATICVEDLTMEELLSDDEGKKGRNINRKIYDLGFGIFRNLLVYKAANAGKRVILVDPAYTTQECCNCGNLVPKDLTERRHVCSCGTDLDRDVNAAKNILRRGLASLASA